MNKNKMLLEAVTNLLQTFNESPVLANCNEAESDAWSNLVKAHTAITNKEDAVKPLYVVGGGVHYAINGDRTPGTVKKVSKSGRKIWISENRFKPHPGQNIFETEGRLEGTFLESSFTDDENTWTLFIVRKDGSVCQHDCKSIRLYGGRAYSRNPSV